MPEEFGPYQLIDVIAEGGMGRVYRAYRTGQNREVAVKLLRPQLADDPNYRRRFARESGLVAGIGTRHIIPIHNYGDIDGRLYIEMPLIDGVDLGTLLRERGPLPPRRAVELIAQIADALDMAHGENVLHRDVKPSNVLVIEGSGAGADFAYLIDFGIAQSVDGSGMTQDGNRPSGTYPYMAPEQFDAVTLGAEVDVYALACVLHECLTGQQARAATSLKALLLSHDSAPPRASLIGRGVPAALDAVIARGLAREPGDRYRSAGALAADARAGLSSQTSPQPKGGPTKPRPTNPPPPPTPTGWRPTGPQSTGPTVPPPTPTPTDWRPTDPTPPPPTPTDWRPTGPQSTGPIPPPPPPTGWRPTGPQPTGPTPPHPRRLQRAVILGTLLAIASIGLLTILPGAPRPVALGGQPAVAEVSRDGRLYVADRTTSQVQVLDVATRAIIATRFGIGDQPSAVVVSPDNARVYVANRGSGTVSVLTMVDDSPARAIPVGAAPAALALSPDGGRLYVANAGDNSVSVIDTATAVADGQPVPVGAAPSGLAISPDGSRLYVANADADSVSVIDTAARFLVGNPIPVGRRPVALASCRGGTGNDMVYVANHDSSTVSVIEAGSGSVIGVILGTGEGPTAIAARPDGRRVYVIGADSRTLTMIDPITNQLIAEPETLETTPRDVTVTPDGQTVIVVGQDPAEAYFHEA